MSSSPRTARSPPTACGRAACVAPVGSASPTACRCDAPPRIEHRREGSASSVRPARKDRKAPAVAVTFLFDECGLQGSGALDKRVPALVDRWGRRAVSVLVGKLFQGDGCVHRKSRSIFYATSSEVLAVDVRRLLLKLGLSSTIHRKAFAYRGGRRTGFTVNILGGRSAYAR